MSHLLPRWPRSLLLLAVLVATGVAQAAEGCPDPTAELLTTENDIVSFYLSDAETSLSSAVDAFGCARPAHAEDVARLLLAKGMILRLQEDLDGSARAFASARVVSPETFNDDYGAEARKAWEEALQLDGKPATVALRNLAPGEQLWLDGAVDVAPLKVSPGLHLLQAGAEVPRFARLLDVSAAEELTVTLPAIALADGTDTSVSAGIEHRKRNLVPALITGGAAAALYGGAVGVRQAYDANPSDAGFAAVNGLYGASIATGVAAGTVALLQLVRK